MPSLRQKLTALITRRYPFYSGCGSFANSKLVRILSGSKGAKTWCKISGGVILADLDDYVGRASYFTGDLDRKITWICKKIVRDRDTVLDIGANIGMVTVLLSDLVGNEGRVLSFEPNPVLCNDLEETIQRNKLSNVIFFPIALGPKVTHIELSVPRGNAGAGSLVRNKNNNHCDTHMVEVRPLDHICEDKKITSIRLIKIDVEGFESDVFLGAEKILSIIKPDSILFELNERTTDNFCDEPIINMLDRFGYDFMQIPKSLIRMRLRKIDLNNKNVTGNDFLAAPRGKVFNEISQLVKAID